MQYKLTPNSGNFAHFKNNLEKLLENFDYVIEF